MYEDNRVDDSASVSVIIVRNQVSILIIYKLNDIITDHQKGIASTSGKVLESVIHQTRPVSNKILVQGLITNLCQET
jgi:hypothetical protein